MADQRITRDELFMEMLTVVEKRSVCNRKHVAAIICRDNRPISIGYNGPPKGIDHCCSESDMECKMAIHAEMNAIAFAAKNGTNIDGTTLYISMSPCLKCSQIILNSGISHIIYRDEYRETAGIELLKQFITVEKYGENGDIDEVITKEGTVYLKPNIDKMKLSKLISPIKTAPTLNQLQKQIDVLKGKLSSKVESSEINQLASTLQSRIEEQNLDQRVTMLNNEVMALGQKIRRIKR